MMLFMLRKVLLATIIFTALVMNGCSTIVFDNVSVEASPDSHWATQKHQIGGIFELFEFQQPKNLEKICDGKQWDHIATHTTFMDGLISQLVPYGIYAPKTTYTKCSDGSELVSAK
ncbi:hypothetical protein A9Q99_22690 [Gammaproteobacteria bacterium 45_16_T64]|nr:hypothetical protein A9Q99_22690 [Gammaproteobacteria bacterium 45_16_T64]